MIYVFHVQLGSRREEVFGNFKMSARGAIRNPPSPVTWVFSLERLALECSETDSAAVIKVWNGQASKAQQLTGAKAVSVKHILEMPPLAKTKLMDHVAAVGWESCAWTEDALSSKKLWPGFKPRGTSKAPVGTTYFFSACDHPHNFRIACTSFGSVCCLCQHVPLGPCLFHMHHLIFVRFGTSGWQ